MPARERWVARALVAYLAVVAFAAGGVPLVPQVISVVFAAVPLLLALVPWNDQGAPAAARSVPARENVGRLLRFPGFWLGLVVAAYVLVGHANASWRFVTDGAVWWMMPLDHRPGLPSGVDAPFHGMNAWRQLLVWSGPWLATCALHVGVRRRRTMQSVWGGAIGVLAAFGLLALVQDLLGARRILGIFESENSSFWGTIVYGNNAAALLNLGLVIALGSTLHLLQRSQVTLDRRSPYLATLALGLVMGGSVVATLSRGAVILLVLVLLAFLGLALLQGWRAFRQGGSILGALVPGLLVVLVVAGFAFAVDRNQLTRELTSVERVFRDPALDLRWQLNRASLEMLEDRWLTGWGAGGFRHLFPLYQRDYPVLMHLDWGADGVVFRYAHNDLVQYPLEFGAIGAGLLALFPLGWLVACLRLRRHLRPDGVMRLAGALLLLLHAGVDFVLYTPAILAFWSLLWAGTHRQLCAVRERGAD